MLKREVRPWVLVRGAGDLATGVIVRLYRCGFRVITTECADPSAIRRKAALCEAVWRGTSKVEGVRCRCVSDVAQAAAVSRTGEVPLLVDERAACIGVLRPAAVVDAILAKHNLGYRPEPGSNHDWHWPRLYCGRGCGRSGGDHAGTPSGACDSAGCGNTRYGCAGGDCGLYGGTGHSRAGGRADALC